MFPPIKWHTKHTPSIYSCSVTPLWHILQPSVAQPLKQFVPHPPPGLERYSDEYCSNKYQMSVSIEMQVLKPPPAAAAAASGGQPARPGLLRSRQSNSANRCQCNVPPVATLPRPPECCLTESSNPCLTWFQAPVEAGRPPFHPRPLNISPSRSIWAACDEWELLSGDGLNH